MRSDFARIMCGFALLLPTVFSAASVQSTTASVQTSIQQFSNGATGPTAGQTLSFPDPVSSLPLQSVSQLSSTAGGGPSAAEVAAQFEDPNTSPLTNPQEFAINLSLNSVSTTESYRALAAGHETRQIVYNAGELSADSVNGSRADLVGRLFLDGALAILAVESDRDLTGAAVILTVTVTKSVDGQEDETLFVGSLDFRGSTAGRVSVTAFDDFPTRALLLNDLSVVSTQFNTFRVLIIPNIQVNYFYSATIGQPFRITADVQIEAQNVPRNAGIAAVLGTPTDALGDVIGLTTGKVAADETLALIAQARQSKSGVPAIPEVQAAPSLCGAFGLELALGFTALGFIKSAGRWRGNRG